MTSSAERSRYIVETSKTVDAGVSVFIRFRLVQPGREVQKPSRTDAPAPAFIAEEKPKPGRIRKRAHRLSLRSSAGIEAEEKDAAFAPFRMDDHSRDDVLYISSKRRSM